MVLQKLMAEQQRAKLDPDILKQPNKNKVQEDSKQEFKQVVGRHNLQDPPRAVQRVWADGSQQEGEDGKHYAGSGACSEDGCTLNFSVPLRGSQQTNRRAELSSLPENTYTTSPNQNQRKVARDLFELQYMQALRKRSQSPHDGERCMPEDRPGL